MRAHLLMSCVVAAALVAACGSSESRITRAQQGAEEANERAIERRLELVEQYTDCIDDADGDNVEVEACDTYLRAAEAQL